MTATSGSVTEAISNATHPVRSHRLDLGPGDEELYAQTALAPYPDPQRPDGHQPVDRGPPGAGVGEVDQMQNQPLPLLVQPAVDQAGAVDREWQVVGGRPADHVPAGNPIELFEPTVPETQLASSP